MSPADSPMGSCKKAGLFVSEAAKKRAELICLPELFAWPYFPQAENAEMFNLAEPIPGPVTEAVSSVAHKFGVWILTSVFERRTAGIYHNTLLLIRPDGKIGGIYRKMHIPDDPGFYEKFYFTPGDLGFKPFDTDLGRIGGLVCWDQWFPEAARISALGGAETLFYPTAIGWNPEERDEWGERQLEAWRTVQRGHAIANGIYVAAVNRVGHEKISENEAGILFWGSSFLAGPMGEILLQAGEDEECVMVAEVDHTYLEDVRRNWPFLRDRRIDAYAPIGKRYLD